MKTRRRLVLFGALALAFVTVGGVTAVTATAKAPQLKGSISADGSSTVGPWTIAAAGMYPEMQPKVRVTVGISGTGGGFERFCRGEIDLSNVAPDQGVRERELSEERDQVGGVHRRERRHHDRHEQAEHMGDLPHDGRAQEDLEHRVERRQLEGHSSGFPDVPLKLFGRDGLGTFDFFTEFINGKGEGEPLGLHRQRGRQHPRAGRVGHARRPRLLRPHFEENKSRLNDVAVWRNGGGCVKPSNKTVQTRAYKPLSRGLYIYAKRDSFKRAEVRSFIGFALNNQIKVAKAARFVPRRRPEPA